MHTIFVDGIATDRYTMGSNEPLGAPSPPTEYEIDLQGPSSSMARTNLPPHLEARGRGVIWLRMSSRPSLA
jgi:hypothetical protein